MWLLEAGRGWYKLAVSSSAASFQVVQFRFNMILYNHADPRMNTTQHKNEEHLVAGGGQPSCPFTAAFMEGEEVWLTV
jgi:hypothetical protein